MRLESTPEIEAFRRMVRAFVAEHAPGVKTHFGVRAPEPALMPAIREWTAKLYRAGLLGIDWPAEYGGRPDAHPLEPFVVAEEIARARTWPPVGAASLASGALLDFGTEQQRARFLPRIRACEDVWCQLFSEPEAGSDLASLRTRARREGSDENAVFVVDGQKVWTTNGHHADMGYLLARTDADAPRHKGITAFALDMRSPGVEVRPLREITGTTDFNEVFLDGVRIPAANVIGRVNDGWRVAMSSLGRERTGVAARGAELFAVLDDLLRLAEETPVGGRPALEDSAGRQAIGELAARVQVNAAMISLAQSRMLHGTEGVGDALLGKIFFSELNHDLAEFGLRLQGTDGLLVEGDVGVVAGGWWQDAHLYSRAYTIAGGANEVLRTQVAERGLGMPR
ncbi:acyl-CoA dehydrogenase family protein [Streptomyces turgidiscabies]|uniref:Acyl-CoA dehydrogenase, middle domain protein n=1 Tax=Streptomyces turgidiscabies (strain Car8) TaxID=698760 RepID=L7F2T1_STRT8|nr:MULTISPECIES: acyl-CoA dehydrogenase family protein [Streptomyces]ELP64925.1 acyl-CoA dehydrogenase, middle domain protein [Streptomyces turgidiscabies Car8]MDX3494609.1 acyl-CoA dehydrogenase family protein [Streptomyces turgidiscabies]GAQ71216.1 acyl-CoA dehydrogenase [Streptomyces turgidiscabies]